MDKYNGFPNCEKAEFGKGYKITREEIRKKIAAVGLWLKSWGNMSKVVRTVTQNKGCKIAKPYISQDAGRFMQYDNALFNTLNLLYACD